MLLCLSACTGDITATMICENDKDSRRTACLHLDVLCNAFVRPLQASRGSWTLLRLQSQT